MWACADNGTRFDVGNPSSVKIIQANSVEDIAAARRLFEEYAASIDTDLCFQNFAKELAGLPGAYAPPRGRLLLAVVDTARLARVALHRDEVRNCKLGTLAAHFRTTVTPNHRAFDDASATA